MNRSHLALLLMALLVCSVRVDGQDGRDKKAVSLNAREYMTEEQWRATGLTKLSPRQLTEFNGWLTEFAARVRRGEVPDPNPPQAGPETIERVNLRPAEYASRTVLFDHCRVDGEIENIREGGRLFRGISLRSESGTYYAQPVLKRDDLNFLVSEKLAEGIVGLNVGGNGEFQARLTCTIESLELNAHVYWVARVTRMDVYNVGGKIARTLLE